MITNIKIYKRKIQVASYIKTEKYCTHSCMSHIDLTVFKAKFRELTFTWVLLF